MNYINNSYPLALLAFSIYLIVLDQVWFSVAVFVVSAFCWFATKVDLKTSKNEWDEIQ